MSFEFHLETDNTELIKNSCREQRARALEAIGQKAEGYAKGLCPVDTGRLRNSITHDCDSHSGQNTVSVGTNVEYAVYVEMGTRRMVARPYIQPSIADHLDEYQSIIEKYLKS